MTADEPVPPRAMTREECREAFLGYVAAMVDYWSDLPGKTTRDRIGGLAFSILVMLDGGAADLPAFAVTPAPHPDDALYRLGRGENWWPDDIDLGPALHEEWVGRGK